MIDELKLRKDTERAAQAKALIENELVVEAFAELEATYTSAWKDSSARDSEAREKLWQAVQIVGKVKTHLQTVIANGAVAQSDLDRLTKEPKRKLFGVV